MLSRKEKDPVNSKISSLTEVGRVWCRFSFYTESPSYPLLSLENTYSYYPSVKVRTTLRVLGIIPDKDSSFWIRRTHVTITITKGGWDGKMTKSFDFRLFVQKFRTKGFRYNHLPNP